VSSINELRPLRPLSFARTKVCEIFYIIVCRIMVNVSDLPPLLTVIVVQDKTKTATSF